MTPRRALKLFAASALAACLTACGEGAPGDAPAPGPDGWIDVPLAEGVYTPGVDAGFRSDRIAIPVRGDGGALEYKLWLNEGDTIVYRWTAEGLDVPALLLSEFHGHTEPEEGEPGVVMFYRQGVGASESGVMTAPFTGIHGWYLKNDSLEDIVVNLDVAGFYEIVPDPLD